MSVVQPNQYFCVSTVAQGVAESKDWPYVFHTTV